MNSLNLWQKKLIAFLHDPPCKPMDIPEHEKRRNDYLKRAGFDPDKIPEVSKICDHIASSSDRFPFPNPDVLKCDFRGDKDSPFKHPMGGSELVLDKPLHSAAVPEEIFQMTQPSIIEDKNISQDEDKKDRISFLLYWRRWPVESAKVYWETAFLPADTRIPDHSVWAHNTIVSAMQGCIDEKGELRAALLLFQLAPVQEFIEQARTTRDLWSGSYLISWLVVHAIKAITDRIGPDCIVFPSLRDQPVFDLLHKKEIYEWVKYGDDTLWTRMRQETSAKEYLTPSIPNRFLAIVPLSQPEDLAKSAEDTIRQELKSIANKCWDWLNARQSMDHNWRKRFDKQVEMFPQITWQIVPLEGTVSDAIKKFDSMYHVAFQPAKNLQKLYKLATETIEKAHRDQRYFVENSDKTELKHIGFAWPYFYALADNLLAARRNTRDFKQWITDENQVGAVKDSFSGKEEVIGSEDWWARLQKNSELAHLFRSADRLGAMNLIKRVWHKAYLSVEYMSEDDVNKAITFESVPEIAAGRKLTEEEQEKFSGYVAVIAIDGDGMGKWMSGENMPVFLEQLSENAVSYFSKLLNGNSELKRPLSPSWQAQFSEALSNYARHIVRIIVEHYGGELIYAGGDDVLAMLPADSSVECAIALRNAFRGQNVKQKSKEESSSTSLLFESKGTNGGFLKRFGDSNDNRIWLVPGPRADISAGIAIGHCHSPLQGLIRAAKNTAKTAKIKYARSALAIAVYKRSGEVVEWGTKWDGDLLPFLMNFIKLMQEKKISNRFPYTLAEVTTPYLNKIYATRESPLKPVRDFAWNKVLYHELKHVISRQTNEKYKDEVSKFCEELNKWINSKMSSANNDDCETYAIQLIDMFKVSVFLARKEKNDVSK